MKIGAIYSTFYDLDLIEDSINSIKEVVDYIVIVHQRKSFAGVDEPAINTGIIKKLIDNKLINDIIYYEGRDARTGMLEKLNIGLDYIKKNKCNYVVSMSADECLNAELLIKDIKYMIINNLDTTYMRVKSYYYDKEHYFIDSHYSQNIHRVDDRKFELSESSVLCDPLTKMKEGKYKLSNNYINHYTFLKDKYCNKLNNSIRSIVVFRHRAEMQMIYKRLQNWKDGDKALVFGNDMSRNGRVTLMERELTMIDNYSIIIPTMWRSAYIFDMLGVYERNNKIKEVIIIDNDITQNKDLTKYKKVKHLKQGQNIYVNPAWNLGVKNARQSHIVIINDDILIDEVNFNKILDFGMNLKENEIIGINEHCYRSRGLDNSGIKLINSEKMGYGFGCCMIMKKESFVNIPDDFKIWYGDNFQYDNNKVFEIKGIEINTKMSQTVNNFRKTITKEDVINWGNYIDNNKDIISFNLATYPQRKKHLLKVIDSVYNQADVIRIYFNEYKYEDIPNIFKTDKKFVIIYEHENIKDTGKFFWADKYSNEYYFTIDDDIIYPKWYVKEMITGMKRNKVNIVTMHGKVLKEEARSPIDYTAVYKFFNKLEEDKDVNYCGTGMTMLNLSSIRVPKEVFKKNGLTDEYLSIYLQEQGEKIKCIKHLPITSFFIFDKNLTKENKTNNYKDILNIKFK